MAGNGIDTSMLHKGAHSASYFDLARSAGEGVEIVDFCIPCNPYFPTPAMMDTMVPIVSRDGSQCRPVLHLCQLRLTLEQPQ